MAAMEMAYRVAPTVQADSAKERKGTIKIATVGSVGMQLQRSDEDRRAIRRSKQMLLMAVAAVTMAVLLALMVPAGKFEPRTTAGTAPALSASEEPMASIGDAFPAQPDALAAGGLPNR